ncbi:MaoC like domain protein [Streptomyces sp. YIM 130001]|uniref:MaoC family dehydratase n=1 Tax=Streptomyces sp. YIM 130001 TaxID=2259644 RepID=UPI000E65347F|nr:MaoC/PaaZ C-terminal domain-containing protein [Streptomyces sp. YIM 130001]RII22158.1 MaoC like domain protein [Streptomyces sp. YIM 130001]
MPTPATPTTVTLARAPRLTPLLARGALLSPLKRPGATGGSGEAPAARLVLTDAAAAPERLASYARICGFPADGPLPVTYPHVIGFPLAMRLMADRAFPLPVLGLVHMTIALTQHRALDRAERPEITVYVDGLVPHRRGTEAIVVTEARVDGVLVWESHSRYLARHRTAATGTDSPERAPEKAVGLPAVAEWELPADLGRRYGAASGDRNPIHLYPLTARLFGFPRAIAHGMWTVARCLAEYGAQGQVRASAEFRAPVLLPGTVTYAAGDGAFALRTPATGGRPGRVHLTGEIASD